jgi:hypothetical protein
MKPKKKKRAWCVCPWERVVLCENARKGKTEMGCDRPTSKGCPNCMWSYTKPKRMGK